MKLIKFINADIFFYFGREDILCIFCGAFRILRKRAQYAWPATELGTYRWPLEAWRTLGSMGCTTRIVRGREGLEFQEHVHQTTAEPNTYAIKSRDSCATNGKLGLSDDAATWTANVRILCALFTQSIKSIVGIYMWRSSDLICLCRT